MEPKEFRYHMNREIQERISREAANEEVAAPEKEVQRRESNGGVAEDGKSEQRTAVE
jgi:hypothetical protein